MPSADADDRIIYNNGTGALMFDADGNATGTDGGDFVTFADVGPGLAVTQNDFLIV